MAFFIVPILAAVSAPTVFGQSSDAEKLIDQGHWKQARTIVEARIHQTPDDALANFLLSQIRNAFGDYNSPLPLAEKAVALDGRVAKYHRQLAEVLGVEAQHANPIRIVFLAHQFRGEIDTALSLDPRDLQAQRDLLEYYLVAPGIAGGDIQKATATAERIAALDIPEGFLARARIASFRKQTAETETMFMKAAQAQPPSYRALTKLAEFYLFRDHANREAAEKAGKELLRLNHGRVDGYAVLAQVYAQSADWTALEATLAEASAANPDDLAPYYRAADALIAIGRDPGRAGHYLRIYLEHDPEGNEPSSSDARRKLALTARNPV
jgi:tetratricopeptide (TPR) repeat protein